jgi:hypothetical protein
MAKRTLKRLIFSATILAALLAIGSPAYAFSSYYTAWNARYPTSQTDDKIIALDGRVCRLCHASSSGGDGWNGYGWALYNNGVNFAAAESENSDDDAAGASNLEEITAGAQPGWREGTNSAYYSDGTTRAAVAPGVTPLDPAASAPVTPEPIVPEPIVPLDPVADEPVETEDPAGDETGDPTEEKIEGPCHKKDQDCDDHKGRGRGRGRGRNRGGRGVDRECRDKDHGRRGDRECRDKDHHRFGDDRKCEDHEEVEDHKGHNSRRDVLKSGRWAWKLIFKY